MVSVIVPTRNSARTLETCLMSIRAQRYLRIEIIVVDNESTDQTLQIAHRLANVVGSRGPERSAQRNYGARLARGDYLLFVDSDMALDSGVVNDCLNAIQSGAPAVVIPEVSIGEGYLADCRTLERSCYSGDDSVESARFFPRTVFERLGGFDEEISGFEDRDLTIRVASGRRLPRTEARIAHDEGRLRLTTVLSKKRYYAASSHKYWRKHGPPSASQLNLVIRPAFLRNWRRLLRYPHLTVGLVALRSLETLALAWGVVEGWTSSRKSQRGSRPYR